MHNGLPLLGLVSRQGVVLLMLDVLLVAILGVQLMLRGHHWQSITLMLNVETAFDYLVPHLGSHIFSAGLFRKLARFE